MKRVNISYSEEGQQIKSTQGVSPAAYLIDILQDDPFQGMSEQHKNHQWANYKCSAANIETGKIRKSGLLVITDGNFLDVFRGGNDAITVLERITELTDGIFEFEEYEHKIEEKIKKYGKKRN